MNYGILNAFCWRLAGAGVKKPFGVAFPALITLYGVLNHFQAWQSIVAGIAAWAVGTLPFTLIGDDINEHWINWVWIWVLALIYGAPMLAYGIVNLYPLWWALAATLSNTPWLRKIIVWEFCECLAGITTMGGK